jgi:NADPH:quinone reductase-like Zn-dependent oxidoreductase
MEGTYKVVELEKFGGMVTLGTRPFREVEKDEILLKMMCSTIHPADISFLSGRYGASKPDQLPLIPGFEGSGLVVKVGSEVDQSLVGKRVSVFANSSKPGKFEGLWAQYHYTKIQLIMPFEGEIDYEKIALALGNPLTSLGFVDTVKSHEGVTAVVQNGASSAFGKIFIRNCKKEGIKTINVVRKEEHIEPLTKLGADHVISTSNTNWEKELKELTTKLNATVCFECVGGDYTSRMLAALPYGSTMYHFGNLELKRMNGFDTSEFVFNNKTMKGWWLSKWMAGLGKERILQNAKIIQEDIANDQGIYNTKVSKVFSLDDIVPACEYYMTNMSEGKVILKANEYN